jgi:ribonuclease Y
MRQGASDYVVEYTSSRIRLPDEELKGRIIGKEGRNIKTFEEVTGVEVDLDSSPGDLVITCFDPVRREIAKISMEKLIADGRIQPAKIEEIVEKTKNEMDQVIFKEGSELCHKLGIFNIPREVIQTLGRFRYRYSYGQNMIEHVTEVVKIGVSIASELKADTEIVKLGCLFHDIGKVIMDKEGSHVDIGVEYLRKFKINDKIINCVAEHHEDRPFSSIESAIVALADHVSGARPGSRTEDFESYVKRMRNLEEAATSFDGVDHAFALSAGREVRVYVKPSQVDDYSTSFLAREIAKKIELEQTYPGVVKVVVIRETRQLATAK